MIHKIIFVLVLSSNLLLSFDKLYFLPKDKNLAKDKIIKLIKNSNISIDIAMYNTNYKKFIKELNNASKRGVSINIFYYKKKGNFNKKINFFKTNIKLHTKLAIFDKKIVYFGSANWKKESFKKSYEIINITDDKNKVIQFNNFFKQLKEKN